MKAASLSEHAARYPILSCDIFDTAIRRTLARPEDVFLAVGARLQNSIACTPEAFALHRQTAERATRTIATSQGHDEVRLSEIYAWLQTTGILEDPIQAARIEFEVECAVCVPIEPTRAAILAHPQVIFVSDTQLPAAWLQELLAACGYGPACRVFSSADLRLSKHTGRLFPALLATLGKPASDILHIGDNLVSDLERPQAHAIAALLLPRQRPPAAAYPDCHHITRLALSHANTRAQPPPGPAQVGALLARVATPLLIGFALFILAQARTRGITRLYFLARDGHLPMAIVHRLLEASGQTATFSLHYLEVSRAAMADTSAATTYLQTTGFLAPGPRLVIDLGWRGSIQAAFQQIAGPTAEIVGCYAALWSEALRPAINPANATAYLSSFGHPISLDRQLQEFYVVLELIFSAPPRHDPRLHRRNQRARPCERGPSRQHNPANRLRRAGSRHPRNHRSHRQNAVPQVARSNRRKLGPGTPLRPPHPTKPADPDRNKHHPLHPRGGRRQASPRREPAPPARSPPRPKSLSPPPQECSLARRRHPRRTPCLPPPHRLRNPRPPPPPHRHRPMTATLDILVFEMTWTGTTHAPGNTATICTVMAAFPGQTVHIHADPTHLAELRRDPLLGASPQVQWNPIEPSRHFPGQTGVVSYRRLAREAATLFAALRRIEPHRPSLVLLLSATPTAIFAASWIARLRPNCAVQIGLHGNLNDVTAARPRNPFTRALDLPAALRSRHGDKLRFLVLEPAIVAALARREPAAASRTDVLQLPVNAAETPTLQSLQPPPKPPLRVGFVGQATVAKGIGVFLRLASSLETRAPGQIAFHLVGRAMPGTDLAAFSLLAEPAGTEHLPRAEFTQRLARLHYVVLPFQPGYYDLAASGALLDALTWLKPIIALRSPIAEAFFAEGGDIGHLCDTEDQMNTVLERLLLDPDPPRYATQVQALTSMREERLPERLAPRYRAMMLINFPFLAS